MRKVMVIGVSILFISLSGCYNRTCPTYTNAKVKQQVLKAENEKTSDATNDQTKSI